MLMLLGCTFDPFFELTNPQDPILDEQVYDQLLEQHIAGFGLAVVVDGALVYQRGYGWESIRDQTEVDPEKTLFRWASMSKMLTGTLAALTAEAGSINLDVDICTYYQDFPHPNVTLRQLLSHTAGAMHYDNGAIDPTPPLHRRNNPNINTGIEWALSRWIDKPLLFEPGAQYSYSSAGFNLAGVVLEHALGGDFFELIAEQLANPMGMASLGPDFHWDRANNRADKYYIPWDKADFISADTDTDVSWKLPGGGFISTVADAGRFCAGLVNGVVPREALERAWENQTTSTGEVVGYGLGWELGSQVVGHSGAQEGAESLLRLYPKEGLCLVGFSNTRDGGISSRVKLPEVLDGVEVLLRNRLEAGEATIQVEGP